MSKPILLVIGGCNGSGKSTFSSIYSSLLQIDTIPYDWDKVFKEKYNSLLDINIKEEMAQRWTTQNFEETIKQSLKDKVSFAYETNFNNDPMHWPELFKSHNFEIHMAFFCLDTLDEAIKRVGIRVESGGHFVAKDTIKKRFKEGYKNLNNNFKKFDSITLIDSSSYNKQPTIFTILKNGKPTFELNKPSYLKRRLPNIHKLLQ